MIVTIKPRYPKECYEVYKRNPLVWNSITDELCFDVNVSSYENCWRLVYWESKVVDLFESGGITHTINNLFWGSEKECLERIEQLKLQTIKKEVLR